MKLLVCIILAFFFVPVGKASVYEFFWKLDTNEILRVKSFVKQNIYTNNSFAKYVEILNKASMDVKGEVAYGDKKYYHVEGIFYVFLKDHLQDREFKLSETLLSRYTLGDNGKMVISKEYLMPVSRDIPVFVRRSMKVGEEWFYVGKEVHKLGTKDLYDVIEISFNVYYKFSEVTNIGDKEIAVIDIKYGFANSFTRTRIIEYLSGSSEMRYYWNISEGKPHYVEENYFFNAIYKDGTSIVYSGTSEGSLEVVKKLKERDRENILSKLTSTFEARKEVELTARENEINLSISDIVFDFDSYKVKNEFISVLSNLAKSIKDYREIDIIVEGHTDDIGGEEYNLRLSEARAREVAGILIRYGIDPTRVSYIGYGEKKPKVPNTSPENRAKNRRVEIKLIWGK